MYRPMYSLFSGTVSASKYKTSPFSEKSIFLKLYDAIGFFLGGMVFLHKIINLCSGGVDGLGQRSTSFGEEVLSTDIPHPGLEKLDHGLGREILLLEP